MLKKVGIFLAVTAWISLSEFIRNSFLLRDFWVEHYQAMGQVFPEAPVNGAVWGIWTMVYTLVIIELSKHRNWVLTSVWAWVLAFPMMWLVIGNLGVLPWGILPFALPLSMLETVVAVLIIKKSGVFV